MKNSGYMKSEELYYSALYGGGVYQAADVMVRDPLCVESARKSPLLKNVLTGELVFCRQIRLPTLSAWRDCVERILDPPDQSAILWPVDLLQLSCNQVAGSGIVDQVYGPNGTPLEAGQGGMVAAFHYAGFDRVVDSFEKLAKAGEKSWKNGVIREIAVQLVDTIATLNREGLVYNDFHFSRIFFLNGETLYLDYSNLAQPRRIRSQSGAGLADGRYPIEFADPSVIREVVSCVDEQSQNYSLCAMLFYLFFGQYAYDGRLMAGYADDSAENHYIKFRDYHKMCVFVFDPSDTSNSLGIFGDEEPTIALWEEAPEVLRNLFIRTLREGSAMRADGMRRPSATEWQRCFDGLGWR